MFCSSQLKEGWQEQECLDLTLKAMRTLVSLHVHSFLGKAFHVCGPA